MSATATNVEINHQVAQQLGLLPEEFDKICSILGRTPNFVELNIFSVMWSEHCSYKNSILWLKTLPREGERLLVGAGEENAGLVDIGDGLACAFKIESHNHPSAIEPFQGAATGVGGIHRDIFTMGARPIAALNSLRFGNLKSNQTKHLVEGVVKGISHYGNCFGVPTVGGEVYFNDCYDQNILVNAMSVGIVKVGETVSAVADGPGNPVFIVGSATGKDGIHGATFASADLTEDSAEDLPAVQVGDPFQEKLLLEASLEAIKTGAIVGMQDMGAAGITCSTSEMTAKSGTGMRIDLDKVPTRQPNMKAWEILLSESQERMLIVGKKGQEDKLIKVFEKWDLVCEEIGVVTDTQRIEFYQNGALVADVPSEPLVLGGGAPVYKREFTKPAYIDSLKDFNIDKIAEPENCIEVAQAVFSSPNIVSKRWITEQYDSMIGTNTMVTNKVSDAAVIRVKGTEKALAVCTDCNSTYVYADPYKGAMIAVAEACRNVVCSGATPVAVTNNLNFGNPYNTEVYWQFVESIKGMGEACRKFNTPVTGGNVSFYNQSVIDNKTEPVFPTPTIGMLGIMEDLSKHTGIAFQEEDDMIILLGDCRDDIGSSEYLKRYHQIEKSPAPYFDIDEELKLQKVVSLLIKEGFCKSAHDISEGGLFTTLIECAIVNEIGFNMSTDGKYRKDAFLFGESQSRVVITVSREKLYILMNYLNLISFPYDLIGRVENSHVVIDGEDFGNISYWKNVHQNTLGDIMS